MAIHESHKIGGTYGNACEACGCGSQTLTAESPCVPTAEGAAFAWAGTPDSVKSLAATLAPREGERTQTIDGRRVAIRSNRAWRELAESALQVAMSAQASVSEWQAKARIAEGNAATWRAIAGDLASVADVLADRATLESNIATYREQRDAEGARAVAAERIADAMTKAFHAERKAHESLDRVTRPLMAELGGLTLSMLPAGAYGGALAAAYTEARYAFTVATPDARAAAFIDKGAA